MPDSTMPDPTPDLTMPAPALTDDASFTPPEQPPMLDDDASGLVNGQEEDELTEDLSVQGGE